MKNIFQKIYNYGSLSIIVVLLLLLILCRECGNKRIITETKYNIKDTTVVHRVYDTSKIAIPYNYPVPVYYDVPNPLPTVKDTVELIETYFADVFYSDTAVNNDKMFIWIGDTLSQNHIKSRRVEYIDRTPVVQYIKTPSIVIEPKTKIYAGFGIGTSIDLQSYVVSPRLLLQTKKDNIYGIGYDLPYGIVEFQMMWKIKLKKDK